MNNENNLIDFAKYKEKSSLINKESYLDYLNRMVVGIDNLLISSRVRHFVDFFKSGHSISFEQLDYQREWYLDRFIIAILETEQFILRIPATKRYIKTGFAKEPIGNCILTANTTTLEGYLALPIIEAEMVYFELHHPNEENLFSFNKHDSLHEGGRKFSLDQNPTIVLSESSDEDAILKYVNQFGVVSYKNIMDSLGKMRGGSALELLESNKKLMRIPGTMFYIRFISTGTKTLNFNFEMMSAGLNEAGVNALLKSETKCFTSILSILTRSDPRASLYLKASMASTKERVTML